MEGRKINPILKDLKLQADLYHKNNSSVDVMLNTVSKLRDSIEQIRGNVTNQFQMSSDSNQLREEFFRYQRLTNLELGTEYSNTFDNIMSSWNYVLSVQIDLPKVDNEDIFEVDGINFRRFFGSIGSQTKYLSLLVDQIEMDLRFTHVRYLTRAYMELHNAVNIGLGQ